MNNKKLLIQGLLWAFRVGMAVTFVALAVVGLDGLAMMAAVVLLFSLFANT